jgi:hypothetical protein
LLKKILQQEVDDLKQRAKPAAQTVESDGADSSAATRKAPELA